MTFLAKEKSPKVGLEPMVLRTPLFPIMGSPVPLHSAGCTADAAMECPGSPLSALRRAALVVADASAISDAERFPKIAAAQMRRKR